MSAAIELKGVRKSYPHFTLKDITFNVPKGCIVGLIGENGAGKSTTLKTILNICHVDAGTITFYGKEINTLSFFTYPRPRFSKLPEYPANEKRHFGQYS